MNSRTVLTQNSQISLFAMQVAGVDSFVQDNRRRGRWFTSNAGLCVPVVLLEIQEEYSYADLWEQDSKKRRVLQELPIKSHAV